MRLLALLLLVGALGGCGAEHSSDHPPLPVGVWKVEEPEVVAQMLLPVWTDQIGRELGYTPSEPSVRRDLDRYIRSMVMEFGANSDFSATSMSSLELAGRWRRGFDGVYVSADPRIRKRQGGESRIPVAFRISGESLYARRPEGEVKLRRSDGAGAADPAAR
jgi:hypothetical protein